MGAIWILFIPFLAYSLCKLRKEDKRIEQTHQTIGKTIERKSRNV